MQSTNRPIPTGIRLRIPERNQVEMVCQCLDDLLAEDHMARIVWAFVQRLDLSALYEPIQAVDHRPGRDATDPRLLFALWLYATLDNVGSARELARRCVSVDAYQWLCGKVGVQLPAGRGLDGGYLNFNDLEQAAAEGVLLFVPPKPRRNKDKRASDYEPRPTDSPVIRDWRQRMGSPQGQAIYRQRAATSERVNAETKCRRGLGQLTVRGLQKIKCVVLFSALAFNLLSFAEALLQ